MKRNQVLQRLKLLVRPEDSEYKEFNAKVVFGDEAFERGEQMLGVRVPALRGLAKELVLEDFEEVLNIYLPKEEARAQLSNVPFYYFEEITLVGMMIGYAKLMLEERLELYRKFIPMIDSWGVNDCTVSTTKWFKKLGPDQVRVVWEFVHPYALCGKEYGCRFAIVMYLVNFMSDDYIGAVLRDCSDAARKFLVKPSCKGVVPYYVEMGIAWCLATAMVKYAEQTLQFIENEQKNSLSGLTPCILRKAAQKSRESFRVSDENKARITELAKRG